MRLMSAMRLGVLAGCVLGLVLTAGVVEAGAAGSPTVLRFHDASSTTSVIGFNGNPNVAPPVGATFVIRNRLANVGSQFGKPSGTIVGRVLLECTVLVSDVPDNVIDGICTGIAHLPDGFFTFDGSGVFNNAPVNYFAITGGVGPYANDRGQIKVVNSKTGASNATVTLTP
jgi:hypothetical protein